ncbi:hypothetical protein LY474_00865 [Myxococcus stipitatus]|uniref:hypothetical protein n=1 Tax=Myxococcus stipitatus TaxID=83455 RepID=UPI001F3E3227|nr:hypothetical protein [Myxococcus stipitatus]MCE9666348.1 hypothetical protein [Myxococcus stipitatus]
MNKRNDDKSSDTGTEQPARTGAVKPRVGRAKQVRRLREKSTLAVRAAAPASSTQGGETRVPRQGRLRQLKATKQVAAKLTAVQGRSPGAERVTLAKPLQLRQLAARKSLKIARSPARVGGAGAGTRQTLGRTAQARQLGTKKQLAKKAQQA